METDRKPVLGVSNSLDFSWRERNEGMLMTDKEGTESIAEGFLLVTGVTQR